MTTPRRRVVVWPRLHRLSLMVAALAALMALVAQSPRSRALSAALVVGYVLMALPRVVLRPGHLEVWSVRGRRRVPWSEVRAVRARPTDNDASSALLADWTAVRLPGLGWEPRGRTAAPFSARDAEAFAREHGHAVELAEEGDAEVRGR